MAAGPNEKKNHILNFILERGPHNFLWNKNGSLLLPTPTIRKDC